MGEERREVSIDEAADLYRSGRVDASDIQIEGICTIFDKYGKIKGQMKVCTVEEAEAEEEAALLIDS